MSKPHSSYLEKNSGLKRAGKSFHSFIVTGVLSLLVAILGFASAVPLILSDTPQTARAASIAEILCSRPNELGGGMSQNGWKGMFSVPNSDAPNRQWTLQESFGKNTNFVWYEGEGAGPEGNKFIVDVGTERGAAFGNWSDSLSKLESVRNTTNCTVGSVTNSIANAGFSVSSMISRVTQLFAVYAFDSGIICESADSTETGCINLLRVIGGTNFGVVDPTSSSGDGGIIGALTAGIYMPLIIIAVAISGFWILWVGAVRRQLRQAVFGIAWVFVAGIVGLTFLMKPAMLARAPMIVSNTIGACVIGAISGNNCATGGGSSGGAPENLECWSTASGLSPDEQMSMTVNTLSCVIWKAFVLDPYSQANFGRSYSELERTDPVVSAALSEAGVSSTEICVGLRSSQSADAQGATLNLNGPTTQVCNLAAYQMYLSTNAVSIGNDPRPAGLDTRWYNVVLTVANDDGMWEAWAPSTNAGGNRFMTMFVSGFATILGSIVIIAISFFAMMYYLTSVMLLAFAPMFFLFGVHPGRGRKILLGWGEIVISNVLKYLASALFLIVTIQFYAAVLSTSENVGLTLIFVVILTGALLLYRNEIINLLGQVNAGGERMSGAATDWMSKRANKVQRIGTAATGSAVGAAIAAGGPSLRDVARGDFKTVGRDLKRTASTVKHSAGDGARRELKHGSGITANATRQYDRVSQDHKSDLNKKARDEQNKTAQRRGELSVYDNRIVDRRRELDVAEAEANNTQTSYAEHANNERKFREIENDVLLEMGADNPAFAEMRAIANQLKHLKMEKDAAVATGDTTRAAEIDRQMKTLNTRKAAFDEQVDPRQLKEFNSKYAKETMRRAAFANLGGHVKLRAEDPNTGTSKFEEMTREYVVAQSQYERSLNNYNETVQARQEVAQYLYDSQARADTYREEHEKLVPGEVLTTQDLDRIEAKAQAAAEALKENDKGSEELEANSNLKKLEARSSVGAVRLDIYMAAEEKFAGGHDSRVSFRRDESVDRILDFDPSVRRSERRAPDGSDGAATDAAKDALERAKSRQRSAAGSKTCSQCGEVNPSDADFCQSCGLALLDGGSDDGKYARRDPNR